MFETIWVRMYGVHIVVTVRELITIAHIGQVRAGGQIIYLFQNINLPETQEHLEMCEGTKFERRGVRISEVMGRVIFWRRMMKKMTQKTATVTSPEVHLPDAPRGGP